METYSIENIKEACVRAFAKKAYWSSQPVRTVGPAGPARRRPTTPGFGFSVPVTQKAAPAKATTAPKSLAAAPAKAPTAPKALAAAPKPPSGLSALTKKPAPAYPTGDADYQRFLSKAKGLGWKYNPNSRVWTTQNGQTHTDDYIRGQLQSRLGTPKLQPPVSQAQTAERKRLDAMKPITYFNDNPMNLANTAVGRGITGALDGIGSGFSAAGRGIAGLASGGVNAIRSLF